MVCPAEVSAAPSSQTSRIEDPIPGPSRVIDPSPDPPSVTVPVDDSEDDDGLETFTATQVCFFKYHTVLKNAYW